MTEPSTVLLERHVRPSKADPLVDEVKLLQANPHYAFVRYPDGRDNSFNKTPGAQAHINTPGSNPAKR